MPIGTFVIQPEADSINAAYRPIIIRAYATKTDGTPIPPVVYCDIYINDVFYKTLARGQYTKLNTGVNTEWEFYIEDALQEYLKKFLGTYGGATIQEATTLIAKVKCKLRASGHTDGFIVAEDTAPVQAAGSWEVVAGTGTETNEFYVVNSALQHNENQELFEHLRSFINRSWSAQAAPLTNRPDHYKLAPNHSDHFPIIYKGTEEFKLLRLKYRYCGQSTFGTRQLSVSGAPACNAIISNPVVLVSDSGHLVQWSLISGSPVKYFISTPAVSAGAPQETISTEYLYPTGSLPVGTHVITVRPLCSISGVLYFGEERTTTIIISPCVPVTLGRLLELTDAFVGVVYNPTILLLGTGPFSLDNVVKPSWMTINITGSTVEFGGTPGSGDVGTDITVSFDVTNCSESGRLNIGDIINVYS